MQRRREKAFHQQPVWAKSIKNCADPQRAKHFLEQLAATSAGSALKKFGAEEARILTALFSGSPILSTKLSEHPEWLAHLAPESLTHSRRKQGLQNEMRQRLDPNNCDFTAALAVIRQFKQREMFRIGARDLAHLG